MSQPRDLLEDVPLERLREACEAFGLDAEGDEQELRRRLIEAGVRRDGG